MADSDDLKFTKRAEDNIAVAVHVALRSRSIEVNPFHLTYALLCEETKAFDVDHFTPQESSILWSVIKKRKVEPNIVAKELKNLILLSVKLPPPAPAPVPTPSSSEAPSKGKGKEKERPALPSNRAQQSNGITSRLRKKKDILPTTPSTSSLLSSDVNASTRPTTPTPVKPEANDQLVKAMGYAQKLKNDMGDLYISPHHLLLALLESPDIQRVMESSRLEVVDLIDDIKAAKGNRPIDHPMAGHTLENLNKFALDLTARAQAGRLDPVIGRDSEIRRVIRILCRRTKNSPILLGEPGVGKTAIAEGLAQRIVAKDVPESLNAKLFSLDMGALIAGTGSRGEYEERIKNVLDEISRSEAAGEPIILFIDELHLIMAGKSQGGNSGGMDAANLIKPALARGELRCMGATTLAEYREYIEKDGALERRFAEVIIQEPSVSDTISILRGVRNKYETHHGVKILDGALVTAAELAHRYITQRRLPDSAIDIIDEASAAAKVTREAGPEDIDLLNREKARLKMDLESLEAATNDNDQGVDDRIKNTRNQLADVDRNLALEQKKAKNHSSGKNPHDITPERIAAIVQRATRIPVERLLASDKDNLLELQTKLEEKVIGQQKAVEAVANAIQRSRNGIADETRPIASFLFTGASGTGKTHLAKTLAECLFNSQTAMMRIDGSEYTESHSISRLMGSPPGYVGYTEGGILTEYIRRNPYSIILIDEIDKACRELVTLFLQVLDDGRLTDAKGRLVDFRNTVIIMTANLGATYLIDQVGETDKRVMADVKKHFPIEFINRIDEIIIFRTLSQLNVLNIVDLNLQEIQQRLDKRKLTLDLDEDARDCLANVAYSSSMGARPLRRVIQRDLLNPISTLLLEDRIKDGEFVKVRVKDGHIRVEKNHQGNPRRARSETKDDPALVSASTVPSATSSGLLKFLTRSKAGAGFSAQPNPQPQPM